MSDPHPAQVTETIYYNDPFPPAQSTKRRWLTFVLLTLLLLTAVAVFLFVILNRETLLKSNEVKTTLTDGEKMLSLEVENDSQLRQAMVRLTPSYLSLQYLQPNTFTQNTIKIIASNPNSKGKVKVDTQIVEVSYEGNYCDTKKLTEGNATEFAAAKFATLRKGEKDELLVNIQIPIDAKPGIYVFAIKANQQSNKELTSFTPVFLAVGNETKAIKCD